MAKLSAFPSRAATLDDDGPLDEFFRSEDTAGPRPPRRRVPRVDESFTDPDDIDALPRARRRVPVRRGFTRTSFLRTRLGRIALAAAMLAGLGAVTLLALALRHFLQTDPRFRIDSSASIRIAGNSEVTRPELLSVFGSDIGRNIFFVPLTERRAALEQLPWVEHATVMRLLPDQLRVAIIERTPIAFARIGNRIALTDAHGVILNMPPAVLAAMHYSFPVVSGIDPGDASSVRAARMHLYRQFVSAIDSGGEKLSEQLSEVDLSDPEDVRAVVPSAGSDILLHFGDEDFLARFHNYQAHLVEWKQQYPNLAAVDLRYERQVVLKMADGSLPDQASMPTPVKQTMPASVQPPAKLPVKRAAPVQHAHHAVRAVHPSANHHPARTRA